MSLPRRRILKRLGIGLFLAGGLLASLELIGCSGPFFPDKNAIVGLSVSPANATVMPGATQHYTATATFGNNTTADATTLVTWSSSLTSVATIDSGGLVTAGATNGQTTISARRGIVVATTLLTVSNKTLASIAITPANATMSIGTTQQFAANATFSDGSMQDITNSVSWNSSNPAVANITVLGLVTAVTPGTTNITATSRGITGTTALNVQ
jgi:trimeric autotransporter adhesin